MLARLERLKTKTLTSKGRKEREKKKQFGSRALLLPGSPTPQDLGLFPPDVDTEGGTDRGAAACHTSTLHRSQHRPGLALVFLSGGESSPGQMKFLDHNLARWLQPQDLESPKVIQAILQGRFHNFCLRLANEKPPNTDLTDGWQ